MAPEFVLLIVNAVLLAYAYLWAYPALTDKTLKAIMARDVAITAAALVVAGGLYLGNATQFNLIFFETNWFVFSALTFAAMETPLFLYFARKHDLSLDDFTDNH